MFSLCPSASPTSCSACTVGKYCYSFTSYDKAQKWHCGNSADETIMLTLSLWLTHPPTQQKLSRLCGGWRDGGSIGGFSSSPSSLLFNIYSAFSVAPFSSRCLQMRRTKPFFVVRQMQKLKLQYPAMWPRTPLPSMLSLRISLLLSTFIVAAKVKYQLELKYGWAEWGSGLPLTSSSSPTLWICKPNL